MRINPRKQLMAAFTAAGIVTVAVGFGSAIKFAWDFNERNNANIDRCIEFQKSAEGQEVEADILALEEKHGVRFIRRVVDKLPMTDEPYNGLNYTIPEYAGGIRC